MYIQFSEKLLFDWVYCYKNRVELNTKYEMEETKTETWAKQESITASGELFWQLVLKESY